MAVTLRNEPMRRSLMFLFLGTSVVLLLVQWRLGLVQSATSANQAQSQTKAQKDDAQTDQAASLRTMSVNAGTDTPASSAPATSSTGAPQGIVMPENNSAQARPVAGVNAATSLVVDLSSRKVYVYRDNQLKTSYPLAVGQKGWETPTGTFQVMEMQQDPQWLHPITKEVVPAGPNNPLGKRWIGFWSDGRTHIGFHGTNQESLIGQAVSHGCLRMRNRDVIELYSQVQEGTQVTVRQ